MKSLQIMVSFLSAAFFSCGLSSAYAKQPDRKIKIEDEEVHLKLDEKKPRLATATSCITGIDISLPKVRGLEDKRLEEKINSHLTLQSLYETSLDEIRNDFLKGEGAVETLSYTVNYLDENLLDVDVVMETVTAYPDTHHEHRLINLKTGDLVQSRDVFKEDQLEKLFNLITKKKVDVEKVDAQLFSEEDMDDYNGILESAPSYTILDLDNFAVTDKGIEFLYSYEAPHALRALAPVGSFEVAFEELRPFVKLDGPLGEIVNHH